MYYPASRSRPAHRLVALFLPVKTRGEDKAASADQVFDVDGESSKSREPVSLAHAVTHVSWHGSLDEGIG